MKSIFVMFFVITFILNDEAVVKIPPAYYHGTGVFVKVNADTAIADFIFIQKYPRELLTDTLFYDEKTQTWDGYDICSF